jgi:hypothetical protein
VARPGFGLSTAVALVRHYVLKTMDGDYLSGRICAVWTQARRFAETARFRGQSLTGTRTLIQGWLLEAALGERIGVTDEEWK